MLKTVPLTSTNFSFESLKPVSIQCRSRIFRLLPFMPFSTLPELTVAPMGSLTTVVYRRLHAQFFGAADRYYLPFVTPTREPKFTDRQLRELAPEANEGICAIPQLLTRMLTISSGRPKRLQISGTRKLT